MITNYMEELLFAFLFIIGILLILNNRKRKQIKRLRNIKEEEIKEEFKERWTQEERKFEIYQSELTVKAREFEEQISQLQKELKEKELRYNEVNQDLELYRTGKLEEINKFVTNERAHQLEILHTSFKEKEKNFQTAYEKEKEELTTDINKIKEELEDIRSRRAAVNEEILRQRKIVDNEDFYKIQIDKNSLSDISLLRSIAPRLIHPEAVNKLIWSGYYQKPLAELRKRAAIEGSGIYKITRLKTGEVYIGQAVNISTRWAEHCKSALGVGTLASSTLHRLMAQDGPENFSFEVIEAVDKDKLKEKESFYIDFYDSKNYGMNSINGVKNGTK